MIISASTQKIHRREKTAKIFIWFFAALTMAILFWITGFILFRGFYSNREVRYDFTGFREGQIPLGNGDEVIFIAHNKLRLQDITSEGLQSLYTSPIRELNTWGEYTGQDIYCKPAVYLEMDEFNGEVKNYLLGQSDLDDWKSYTVKWNNAQEMIDYIGSTSGGLGYIRAEDKHLLNRSVQVISIRDLVVQVSDNVTAIHENRSLQALRQEDLIEILTSVDGSWADYGGPDNPISLAFSHSINPTVLGIQGNSPYPKLNDTESMKAFLSSHSGAMVISRYGEISDDDYELLPVDRRERGANLTLSFLLEKPASGDAGGISYFIINTLLLIIFTLLFSTPIGIMAAVYLVEYAKQGPMVRVLRMGTETLAGIPSIVFGLFGRIFFVRILGLGIGFLSSTLTVTLMILPTLVRTSEEALKAVPSNLREGSLAMGATKLQTLIKVVLPAASPGILTGIILAIGRVVGETAVLLYTLGSGYDLVRSLTSPARVLSLHLYLLFSEAVSFDRAFATATVLIFMVLLTNLLTKKLIKKQSQYAK